MAEFKFQEKLIIPLFDPPHLIKGMRNNFLTKNIEVVFPQIPNKKKKKDHHFKKIKKFILTPDFIQEIHNQCDNLPPSDQNAKYIGSWDILELSYDIDTKTMNTIQKQMPKIFYGHIIKKKIHKMKVKTAVQALSR